MAMSFPFLRRARAVGLDVGGDSVKALVLEKGRSEVVIAGRGVVAVERADDPRAMAEAIHAALADAGADGEPVVAAVGGPEVVIRQVSLPPVPPAKILPALEIQHRELGLLPPGESVMDAQVLRRSKDGMGNEILSVGVPRARIDERIRLLQQASVTVKILDVEPLALLNGALHLIGLDSGELLVLLTVGRRQSVLCVFSEQGPVVARYLNIGAENFAEQLAAALGPSVSSVKDFGKALSAADTVKAEAACRELVERMAEDIRLSLAFYRTEYDRESLPRYAIGGSVFLPNIPRWVADRLGLGAPLETMDPLRAVEVKAPETPTQASAHGPQFLQAFGLALRGL
jgi:type IV pilus assembly protein PilM